MDLLSSAQQLLQQAKADEAEAERWLSLAIACRRLGITRYTAYRWIETGRLRKARQTLTGRWQVTAASLREAEARMNQSRQRDI